MKIEQEKTGELTASIKIELEPADYQEKVDKQLKEYQRKANMPGFRPGHVPFGLVKKMYGKSLLYEVVNKEYSEALYKYIDEQKINILGAPLANEEKNTPIDLDKDTILTFWFDIAFAPEFTVDITDKTQVNHYKISVTDETVEKYLAEMQKRHGTFEQVEMVDDNDMISGEFAELDENGNLKEGGIKNDAFIYMEQLADEEKISKFRGLKAGEFVDVNPKEIGRNDFEAAYFIGKKKEELENISSLFRFTVKLINRNKNAELNEEFYKKVYPGLPIENIDQMKEQIRKDAIDSYQKECERKFVNDATEIIRNNTQFDLPEAFLKRYILETQTDTKLTKEKIEEDFEQHRDVIKWQLIENKIIKEHGLNVTAEEMRDFVKGYFRKVNEHEHEHTHEEGEAEAHHHEPDENYLNQIADNILKNEEEAKRISDKLFDDKLLAFLKSKLSVNYVDVSYDEFVKIISTKKQ
ncbi:MAG TPA: trigger factor [Bacteroidales bacterium]|nr:trigger factor [Bacteroidales bacterium]